MEKIDVLMCSDHSLHTLGGAQLSSNIILEGLKDRHVNFGVIQPGQNSEKKENIQYFEIGKYSSIKTVAKNPFRFLVYMNSVRKIVNKEKPSIVHAQAQANFFIVTFLKKLGLIPKDTFILFTERGLFLKYGTFIRNVFKFLMDELNVLITTTQFNMEFWQRALKKWDIALDDYKVIENTAGEYFEQIDEKYISPYQDQLVLGFVGRWNHVKNWPLAEGIAIEANKRLGENLIIKMAISSDDSSAAEEEAMEMFRRLSSIMGERFQGKININFEQMDQFYYDIDVYALTTIKDGESFGRTIVEAMSRNTVVLTTDAGGSVEVVNNDELVLETPGEFADKIVYFYENQEKMKRLKQANRQRVKDVYSLENNLEKHIELYESILKR